MGYAADFIPSDTYRSKITGAATQVTLINEDNPDDVVIGAVSSFNGGDNFEQVAIEEGGNDGVDEHATGRHDGSGNMTAFFTPAWNDALPTRQDFFGKTYILLEQVAPGRSQAGTTLNAYTGVKLSRVGTQHGSRGAKTLDLAYVYQRRYSGSEWATLTGTA